MVIPSPTFFGGKSMYFKSGDHKQAGLRYSVFKALVSPRPIGWISTIDENGIANLAPYSFFNAVSELPPMVMFVSAPDARKQADPKNHHAKDSLANIRQTKEFGVNIASEAQIQAMVASSAILPAEEDEFIAAGLEKMTANDIAVPLVKGAPAHFECRLHDMIELPGTESRAGCVMVIGHVVSTHIDDRYIQDGKVDVTKYRPVSRLGYKDYSVVEHVFEIEAGLNPS